METYRRYSAPAVPASRILFFDHGKNGKNGNFLQVADVLKGVTPLALLFPSASDLQFPSAVDRWFRLFRSFRVRLTPRRQPPYMLRLSSADNNSWLLTPTTKASPTAAVAARHV